MTSFDIDEGLRALSAVRAALPGTILAGGYLRDKFFGRPAKDIDLFAPFNWNTVVMLQAAGLGFDVMHGCSYGNLPGVQSIYNVRGFALPVQVIVLEEGRDPVADAKEHDFGFCQVWHDGWRLHFTPAFERAQGRIAELVHCESEAQHRRSMRRWERLKQKYPDFTLVDKTAWAEPAVL